MKHSIPVKFLAVLLCAASLLAVAGGGLSIGLLAENNLYEKTPDEIYAERLEDMAWSFAEQLAQTYASTNLGGCPEEMVGHYHYFNAGFYGYTLQDAAGNVLDAVPLEDATGSYTFRFQTSGSYMKVVNTYGTAANATTISGSNYTIYDAIAEESTLVYTIICDFGDQSVSHASGDPIGCLDHTEDGRAHFVSFTPYIMNLPESVEPTHILFLNEDNEYLYEISHETDVGQLFSDEDGLLHFIADAASGLVTDVPTEPTLVPDYAAQYTMPVTAAEDGNYFSYYDNALGQDLTLEYVWEVMPDYTVTVTLLPGASSYVYERSLANILYAYRGYFPWLLGAGLLLLAVTLVYLCCAAGRKPGSDEIRPTALNRLPLDLYTGIGGFAVVCLGVACAEGGTALFREDAQLGLGFAALCAYGMCLICVGFLFAFSAQVKSKNRYWLRNSLCGRLLILALRLLRRLNRGIRKAWPAFCRGIRCGWSWLCRFIAATYRFMKGAIVKICLFLWRLIKTVWKKGIIFLGKVCKFVGTALKKFFSLLPLTWQWLVAGIALMSLVFIALASQSGGMMLFALCAGFALILYGAHCFGVLLESARKMRKGDLETKVDDTLLLGSFRDFSAELNGLASVTTVAVQKQLKSERMKAELVTNVSHDIKTPLTSIINYVDLMKRPHTDEEHELYLEVLDRQSQRLKKLIEDLMEMSKASTGNMNVDLIELNAAEAVNQALGEFADKFRSIDLTPVFHHPEEPVTMLADGRLVWRVLSNLFSNAYKYALPGTRLYIDLLTLDGHAVITIKNISKEQLNVDASELLERFVRGDASRYTEGSGLGLNIAKNLVELQQGRLEVMVDGDLFKVTLIFPRR